ncbi:MAG TPA: guanylate kinase [Bacteroidota bacterium]|nr:guanylate kinase [Candidatus Kapabacteria bacterium]HRS02434.1 guanylate kinase [Bacteroidota bacterium]HRT68014.1 guanylate kinase [Bacteroidota bacterium]
MNDKKLFVFSSPSGGGKSTIVRAVLDEYKCFILSVSATTRKPRENEIDGLHYYFVSREKFEGMIKNDELIEYEEIFGNYYGTPKSEVEKVRNNNKCLIFDIDVKGALSIKKLYPGDSCLIFIAPPSIEELRKRLILRHSEEEKEIQKRLERANYELSFKDKFDYVVINDDLQKSIAQVKEILKKNAQCLNYLVD